MSPGPTFSVAGSPDVLSPDELIAAVFVPRRPENFVETVRRLTEDSKLEVVLGAPGGMGLGPLADFGLESVDTWSAASLVNYVWSRRGTHVLAVSDAALVPPDFLDVALGALGADVRVATVSFLSNAAGFLSFPHRNHPVRRAPDGHDEISVTRKLRPGGPAEHPVPIPMASGPVVLLSSGALAAVGFLDDAESGAFAAAVADFSFRARARGFMDLLDATTFCARPSDISVEPVVETVETGLTPDDNGWLHERHPMAHPFVAHERMNPQSALGLAFAHARAKVMGLRVLVDGSCLGDQEMGTQVTTIALIEALADREDVSQVGVLLPGRTPDYARSALAAPKVSAEVISNDATPAFGRADIFHRPFQPGEGFSAAGWRTVADRVVVTVHDFISYQIGAYFGTAESWLRYREAMHGSLRDVDGVVVVSDDVRQQLQLNRLPIDPSRVFVVPNGTEHLTGNESARIPAELSARGFVAGSFLLLLGTNYSHKNRDLGLRAFVELRQRGHDLALVVAGAGVPWGSSRALEGLIHDRDNLFVLPDVRSEERNWLLRHAAVVLYPTSAEGFGLIPFEAARFGTPTVNVAFGPLAEVGGEVPVVARDWSPKALADAAEALLTDPGLAARQVASCLEAAGNYRWSKTAEMLTDAYRTLIARPPA